MALHHVAVNGLRPGPALRCAQYDHRPNRPLVRSAAAGRRLDRIDAVERGIDRRGHGLMHGGGIVAFDKVGLVAIAPHQLGELLTRDAREQARVGDLVAVEVQDRQYRTVGGGIEELVRVPCGCQRTRLGLAVTDNAGDRKVRVVEHGAVGM